MPTLPVYLDNPVRPYHWGSHTALAAIQRREAPAAPEAELWIGDHPTAPSRLKATANDDPGRSLIDLLRAEGSSWLGSSRRQFGDRLPFLLKILAAAQPLSLQVHPNRQQAQSAYRKHPGAPYVDDNHKPELLCALTPFKALHGFRSPAQIVEHFDAYDSMPPRIQRAMEALRSAPSESALRQLLAILVSLTRGDIEALHDALDQPGSGESTDVIEPMTLQAITQLRRHYPEDGLVVAPLLLNVVTLEPGQALYTGPGVLHSYLEGTGVELMATSDNVLRAGLTSKRTDTSELLRVTRFEQQPSLAIEPTPCEGSEFSTFLTPAAEFELASLHWPGHSVSDEQAPAEIQILLCTNGDFTVTPLASPPMVLPSGEAMLVPAHSPAYKVEGEGSLFRATVPGAR